MGRAAWLPLYRRAAVIAPTPTKFPLSMAFLWPWYPRCSELHSARRTADRVRFFDRPFVRLGGSVRSVASRSFAVILRPTTPAAGTLAALAVPEPYGASAEVEIVPSGWR